MADDAATTYSQDVLAGKYVTGRLVQLLVVEILDLLAEAIWADVTGRNRDYGYLPGGNEP